MVKNLNKNELMIIFQFPESMVDSHYLKMKLLKTIIIFVYKMAIEDEECF